MKALFRSRILLAAVASLAVVSTLLAGSLSAPAAATAGDAIEFAFVVKTENQIQFGICTNINQQVEFGGNFTGTLDLTLAVRELDGTVVKDSGWDWTTGGTQWGGLPSACRDFDRIMQWVWPAWNSVSGLEPGTTYDFTAVLTATPTGGQPHVFTTTQQVTTGGGCPVGAPDDSALRTSMWNGIGLDADSRAVILGIVVDPEAVPGWLTALHPEIVQWVPEYLWTGKTLAQAGYYWDPVTRNFGPPVEEGDAIPVDEILELVHLDACSQDQQNDVDVIVDPGSDDNCVVNASQAVEGVNTGACEFTVQVTSLSVPSGIVGPQVAPRSLSVRSLVMVRPATAGAVVGTAPASGETFPVTVTAPAVAAPAVAAPAPLADTSAATSTAATPAAVPTQSSLANPARPVQVMAGVTAVSAAQAAAVRPTVVREPVGTTPGSAPRLEVLAGEVSRPVFTGLPAGVEATVRIGRAGKYSMLGRTTTTGAGRLAAPALRIGKPGVYTLRITTSTGEVLFARLVVGSSAT